MPKALVIVAPEKFQDYEYLGTTEELANAGISFDTASTRGGRCTGKVGIVTVDAKAISEIRADEYDSVVFIGGAGTPAVRADAAAVALAEKFFHSGKVVGAICWAPTILAKAGVLKGRKSTVWVGFDPEHAKETHHVIQDAGAVFVNERVVVDGKIVTGNGPRAAHEFGKALANAISEHAGKSGD